MANSQMPNIPGAAVMTDTLDFVKNLWGSMSVPGLTAPTLSVDELDKKINDLKAVEAWLNLYMSMLRGSIQALEVQRNTIATLKSVGASLAAAVNQGADKSKFDSNPYVSAFFHQPSVTPPKAAAPAPTPPAPASGSGASAAGATGGAKPAAPADVSDAAQLANPAVWWNLLQDQFKQAVSNAMSPEAVAGATARATETAAKFVAATGGKPPAATASSATSSSASVSAKAADKPAVKAETVAKPAAKKAPAKRAPAGKAGKA